MNNEIIKLIKELEELSTQDKRINFPKNNNGWYDHKEADPDWICEWNSKVVDVLDKIDKIIKTDYSHEFCEVQKYVDLEKDFMTIDRCLDNSRQCIKEIINKVNNL